MNNPYQSRQDAIREKIEMEKKTDRLIKRVSTAAWGGTIFFILVFIGVTGYEIYKWWSLYQIGAVPAQQVFDAVSPLLISLGTVSFVVALVSTIGVFLRLRTSALSEVQIRLATLEEILMSRAEEQNP